MLNKVMINREVVRARRQQIQQDARCEGCGATLATCQQMRGQDPTAPEWFGCCAQGLFLGPCRHHVDAHALLVLAREIEAGQVRHPDDLLLDEVREFPPSRSFHRFMDEADIRAEYEEATWD